MRQAYDYWQDQPGSYPSSGVGYGRIAPSGPIPKFDTARRCTTRRAGASRHPTTFPSASIIGLGREKYSHGHWRRPRNDTVTLYRALKQTDSRAVQFPGVAGRKRQFRPALTSDGRGRRRTTAERPTDELNSFLNSTHSSSTYRFQRRSPLRLYSQYIVNTI